MAGLWKFSKCGLTQSDNKKPLVGFLFKGGKL